MLTKETKCVRCANGDTRTADGFHLTSVGHYKRCADLPPYEQPATPTSKTVTPTEIRLAVEWLAANANGVSLVDWEPRSQTLLTAADQIEAMASVGIRQEREIERLLAINMALINANKSLADMAVEMQSSRDETPASQPPFREVAVKQVLAAIEAWNKQDGRMCDHDYDLMNNARQELQWILDDHTRNTSSSVEPECAHTLVMPESTLTVIDPFKAKCRVCYEFFDLPLNGAPSSATPRTLTESERASFERAFRNSTRVLHEGELAPEKASESPDPVYCSACGQEDRDCYCDPSTPPENGTTELSK